MIWKIAKPATFGDDGSVKLTTGLATDKPETISENIMRTLGRTQDTRGGA